MKFMVIEDMSASLSLRTSAGRAYAMALSVPSKRTCFLPAMMRLSYSSMGSS